MTLGGSPEVAERLQQRLAALKRDRVVERIWQGDHTVWGQSPTGIADRLGWLTAPRDMRAEAPRLVTFAHQVRAAGITQAVLCGMGGAVMAPEVIRATFGVADGAIDLTVLDSTDPAQLLAVERSLDLEKTLFIFSSKSGGTIETMSHLEYFWAEVRNGSQFVAITDPGTPLADLATSRGFREVFLNPETIGGRFSGLSLFGLVPAALLGVDFDGLLGHAAAMADLCAQEPHDNPGAWLGAVMAECSLAGRDKLTLILPPEIGTLGWWIEQMVSESTGKGGGGILPIEGEPLGEPADYGPDRAFIASGATSAGHLERAGFPVAHLRFDGPTALGAEFFRWQFATAVAGAILGLNPFDQPDVQAAKDATSAVLAGQQVDAATPSAADVLSTLQPRDYIAINAYVPRTAENAAALQLVRLALRARYRAAVTIGFGPRFLHSTGQYFKGGPNTGVFLQAVSDAPEDVAIPGQPYTFGELKRAQALGDLASLREKGRRVARLSWSDLLALA
ncbi:MAG: glucose-6-phosphate isomerase [Dehalococcoidia bacterium]